MNSPFEKAFDFVFTIIIGISVLLIICLSFIIRWPLRLIFAISMESASQDLHRYMEEEKARERNQSLGSGRRKHPQDESGV